jgi:ATP-dependent helicase/nuclease subunit A
MHRLFEMLIRHRADPPAVTAERLRPFLEGEGAEAAPDQVRAALSMAEGLRQSRLWEEVEAAREVRTEVAFARLVAGRGQGESAKGGADGREHVRNGTVDLAYRRPGGWVVVDFKTDRFDEADAALGADHPYRRQVRAYAQAWAALTGEPVAQAGLWLADPRRFVAVGEIGQRAQ